MERDQIPEDSLTIRVHHICIFEDIIPKFLEFSHGIAPWGYPTNKFGEITAFVQRFSENEIEKDKRMRTYFETSVIEVPSAEEDYLYTIDLIGADEESSQKVLDGRSKFFMEIFRKICRGKDTKVFLSDTPDGYCSSCAIGKHCRETGPDEFNNDLKYKNRLLKLMQENNDFFRPGMVGFDDGGRLFVTAELLFNPQLYKHLNSNP